MKITNIETTKDKQNVYVVTFEPNWIQRLFGVKPCKRKYKDSGDIYTFGSGHVYYDTQGEAVGNGSYIGTAIDAFRRKW